jgi:diguanylate cyclase (GGDEF)-like protein
MRQPVLHLLLAGVVIAACVIAVALPAVAASASGVAFAESTALQAAEWLCLLTLAAGFGLAAVAVRKLTKQKRQLEEQLASASQTLEQRVAERTRILTRANERLAAEVKELRTTESRLRSAQATLEETTQKYARLSQIDPLTNLANRRKFDESLELEWRRGVRNKMPLALVLVDVDYFKLFNDTYGHSAGDDCLREVADVIAAAARRPGDLGARIGGEEFTVLLCDTGTEGALAVAAQIQSAIEQLSIEHETTRVFNTDIVTVSIGVVSMMPAPMIGPSVLIYRADEALYSAKQAGRNCVRCYDDHVGSRRSASTMRAAPALRLHESLGRKSQ